MTKITIGRSASADHTISNPSVSSIHLTLEAMPNGCARVTDMNSTNGTFICRGVGRIKISCEVLALSEILMLGNYQTTLIALMPDQSRFESPSLVDNDFSRYIRTEDGQFTRKKS
jgi:hypothetical protein